VKRLIGVIALVLASPLLGQDSKCCPDDIYYDSYRKFIGPPVVTLAAPVLDGAPVLLSGLGHIENCHFAVCLTTITDTRLGPDTIIIATYVYTQGPKTPLAVYGQEKGSAVIGGEKYSYFYWIAVSP
jgi:hypothetical protein